MEGRGDRGVIEAERGIELKMDALLESSLGVNIIGDKDNGLFIKESIWRFSKEDSFDEIFSGEHSIERVGIPPRLKSVKRENEIRILDIWIGSGKKKERKNEWKKEKKNEGRKKERKKTSK